MEIHNFVFIAQLLSKLKQNSVLEGCVFSALLALLFRFFVLSESVETGCFEQVDLLIVFVPLHELVVDVHSASKNCVKGKSAYL